MNSTLTVWLQLIALLAVEVAVIVGLAAQLQRFTKSAIWRRTIWHACLLSLLLLVVFEFTGAARGLAGWLGKKSVPAIPIQPSTTADAGSQVSVNQPGSSHSRHPELQQASGQPEPRNTQQLAFPSPREISKESVGQPVVPVLSHPIASESASVLWLGLAWMLGAGIVIGRALVSWTVLEIFRRQRRGSINVEIEETAQALALRLGIQRRVRLLESSRICAPVAFGIFRPTIGLPLQFAQKFNFAQQEAMLAHELAHLAGNDPAWYLLADLLAAMLWWHPLIWWSRRQLQAQSELAADEASLLVADGPGVLAECLVELGARLAQTRSFIPLGVAGSGYRSGLGRRVERLVKLEGTVWCPPNRIRCGLVSVLGPLALVAAAILCTAWAVPPALTKGENMQTMKQTWKKSLAAFALLTAISSDNSPALADATGAQTAAQPKLAVVSAADVKPSGGASGGGGASAGQSSSFSTKLVRLGPASKVSPEQRLLREKLNNITLDSVHYEGLPLGEVINKLVEQSELRDPGRQGINFVLEREVPTFAGIDPATGLPTPLSAGKADLSSVTVQISPAIKNVRLIDVLEVITKTADRPIHYSIEDYGVVFSPGAAKPADAQNAKSMAESMEMMSKTDAEMSQNAKAMAEAMDMMRKFDADRSQSTKAMAESMDMMKKTDANAFQITRSLRGYMEVMTFKVDTNTFFSGMERTFGITLQANKHSHMSLSEMNHTIEALFEKMGIDMNVKNKSVFYNDANGILMVRGTREDLAVAKGVIETLGGVPYSPSEVAFGGGGGGGSGGSGSVKH